MQYKEFVQEVQKRAQLPDLSVSATMIDASVATLGERLDAADREGLGAQLPRKIKEILAERHSGDLFSLEEYYNRVSARAGVGYPEAVRWSKVVMSVLGSAITSGLLTKILSSLPPEFGELFGTRPITPLSASSLPE
ncbi:MAG: DUF2267 domain-containing protein [Fibrobacter sp.]|nr:DUF2267 domain-containing protein [Fibrobacter sp.]